MTKPSINPATETNHKLIDIIRRTKIDFRFLTEDIEFREMICDAIKPDHDILDVGEGAREFYPQIKARSKMTLDINDHGDYPDVLGDICGNIDSSFDERFDHIICLAILEHVYDPLAAVSNLHRMTKPGGTVSAYVPYLFPYHAPKDLSFQDYYRFSKDGLSYLFRDYSDVTLYPIRGRFSTGGLIMFGRGWKRKLEKRLGKKINFFLDRFADDDQNMRQCSGFNIWAVK